MIQLEELPQHLETLSSRDWDRLFELIPKIERTQAFRSYPDIIRNTVDVMINPVFDWMSWKEGKAMATSRNYNYSQLDTITLCKLLGAIIRVQRVSWQDVLTGVS